jgi:hypothetical protein
VFRIDRNLRTLCLIACISMLGLLTTGPAALGQAGNLVVINADKVVVINGQKVFPIGLALGPPPGAVTPDGVNGLTELRNAGACFIRTGAHLEWTPEVIAAEQQWMDAAAASGMLCWSYLGYMSTFAAGDTVKETALRSAINQFKNHPGLGFWKNWDEAAFAGEPVDNLVRGYEVIRQEDPNHPVIQVHAPRLTVEQLQPYNACADLLSLDIYPIGYPPGNHSLLANKEISMVGDWTAFLGEVANDQLGYFMTLQIAWSGVIKEGKTLRFPTFDEERFMAYQAIINGARGLIFFGGHLVPAMAPEDAALGWNWRFWNRILRPLVEEIGEYSPLAPALVAPTSSLPIQVTGASDVEFCVREAGADLYILACKREGSTVNVTFSGLPSWAGLGELMYEEPRKVTASNGSFTDWFGPFEVHVYRFHNSIMYGDFDGDGDIDQEDFGHLQVCMSGYLIPQTDPACQNANLDGDSNGDVSEGDFQIFFDHYTGPYADGY